MHFRIQRISWFIVRKCSESKLTVIFEISMIFLHWSPIFISHQAIFLWTINKQNIKGNPPEYDMNRWICPVWWHFFDMLWFNFWRKLCWKQNRIISSWITHSQIVQVQPGIDILLKCLFDVLGISTFLMGKLSYKFFRIIRLLGRAGSKSQCIRILEYLQVKYLYLTCSSCIDPSSWLVLDLHRVCDLTCFSSIISK